MSDSMPRTKDDRLRGHETPAASLILPPDTFATETLRLTISLIIPGKVWLRWFLLV